MENKTLDPYAILGIPHNANEEMIRNAFHQQVKQHPNNQEIHQAYEMIRSEKKRFLYRWTTLTSYLNPPPLKTNSNSVQLPIEALAKELAFLSTWELGEDNL